IVILDDRGCMLLPIDVIDPLVFLVVSPFSCWSAAGQDFRQGRRPLYATPIGRLANREAVSSGSPCRRERRGRLLLEVDGHGWDDAVAPHRRTELRGWRSDRRRHGRGVTDVSGDRDVVAPVRRDMVDDVLAPKWAMPSTLSTSPFNHFSTSSTLWVITIFGMRLLCRMRRSSNREGQCLSRARLAGPQRRH